MDPLDRSGSKIEYFGGAGPKERNRSGGGYFHGSAPAEYIIELPAEFTANTEGAAALAGADPVDFLPEAMDIRWQHFARAWNGIIGDLRGRDHLSDAERDDLSFTFLTGRDVEQIFDAPEYIILPPMMTSPVFSTASFNTGRMTEYASFLRTLVQSKDLLCVLLTEVLGVVRPGDMHVLMRLVVDLARVEGEQMSRRRMDDVDGYVRLREACSRILLALQSLAAATTALPAPDPDDEDADDAAEDGGGGGGGGAKKKDRYASEASSDEGEESLEGLTAEEAERRTRRREQKRRRRKKREIKAADAAREEKVVEAINLEMKYGCTGFLSKSTRKNMKKKGGAILGCFVVDEDLIENSRERKEELRGIEREERRERGLASDDEGDDDGGGGGGGGRGCYRGRSSSGGGGGGA